jgi:aldehyde dehydrogenase (NAD+)
MQEEIFGPVLPVVSYRSLDEAIAVAAGRPAPLALYVFSRRRASSERLLRELPAGGALVNDVVLHFANTALPFGGVGPSGFGRSHGYAGFKAFSNERAVMRQPPRSLHELLYPPYTTLKARLVRLAMKYL